MLRLITIINLPVTELSTCTLTLTRQGLYGTLDVPWQSGFPVGQQPGGFRVGTIQPVMSTVTISHGIAEKNFTIQVFGLHNFYNLNSRIPKEYVETQIFDLTLVFVTFYADFERLRYNDKNFEKKFTSFPRNFYCQHILQTSPGRIFQRSIDIPKMCFRMLLRITYKNS